MHPPEQPDGYHFEYFDSFQLSNGDTQYNPCEPTGFCFHVWTHEGNIDIRKRFQHIFRDNGDGTLAFGIEGADGRFDWVQAPGAFPKGPLRVVIAFHNYTGTKDGDGPGANGNLSPSEGGFTWHWDDLTVTAQKATPTIKFFGASNADRIVTPENCVAFSQSQRQNPGNTDVSPLLHCIGDPDLDL